MNIKELVIPISFAFLSVFALNYFFSGNTSKDAVESSFVVPREKKAYKPLNVEVDFYDQKRVEPSQVTICDTEWANLLFSTDGASLESIDFKRELNGQQTTIRTIFPVIDTERSEKCFLVALDNATPFYYTLVSSENNENAYELIYVAGNDECVIQKRFVIDKHKPKIDLSLEVAPKNENYNAIESRIFFPAPFVPDLKEIDIISSILIDQADTFAKTNVNSLDIHRGWFTPTMFGIDNRYFIHALIQDSNHFAQRAYYKLEERTRLFSVLEGPVVTEKTSWTLSFYFGPKELNALAAVDARLEKTLDYSGILSFLAKLMLYLLNWLYKYLHNYGLAIIALTFLIQLLLLPVSLRNNEEKWKKQQMEYQRQLAYIEQRFKDKPEQLLAERTELIRKNGLPGFGCLLPLLLQLPIFFALSRVLSSSFELYQAPMLWIPDLSSKDPLYILPVLVTITMLMQDINGDSQQKMSKIVMAFVFGAVTSSFSAGLTLYICLGRLFSFVQAKLMRYFKLV
ncbi:MAG TPA: membrane protein insertase YidC [Candidatus Babeliales bacterium]|nr:membrane protein insertase YidC [Candidatus Babeliales bacterium]